MQGKLPARFVHLGYMRITPFHLAKCVQEDFTRKVQRNHVLNVLQDLIRTRMHLRVIFVHLEHTRCQDPLHALSVLRGNSVVRLAHYNALLAKPGELQQTMDLPAVTSAFQASIHFLLVNPYAMTARWEDTLLQTGLSVV
jgi:hypothetical protein